MSGKAYTVVDGSGAIRDFDVDVVGRIDDGKGSSRMIMARASGPVIEKTGGILQGMSGSPVYIDGQLVGAVAAGIKDMNPYTFFITPIEDMTPLWQMPDTKDKTRLPAFDLKAYQKEREKEKQDEAKKEAEKKETEAKADKAEAAKPEAPAKKDAAKPEPKASLYLAGFNQAGMDFLKKSLPEVNLQYAPMSTPPAVMKTQALYNAALEPGSPVGVAVAYGDFAVGATGTVTAVDGKRILAFGHPFLHRGNVSYFMTDASVVGTISGTSNGMKIASVGRIIGRINQDREAGVAGILGEFPSVVPVRVHVEDKALGATADYGTRIAYDEDLLAKLVGGVAYSAISKTSDTLGSATASLHFAIRTNAAKNGIFERSNMFYSTADVGQVAVGELIQAMNILSTNTDKETDIVDVKVDVKLDGERKTATLLTAVPDKLSVKPGETVNLTATIKPYRKEKETLVIPYKVPETQKPGAMHLDLRGGGFIPATSSLLVLTQAGADALPEESPKQTTEEQLATLSETNRNNVILVTPSASRRPLSDREKRQALREAQKNADAHAKKISLLPSEKKKEKPGETSFETHYIIDNVIHATLQVEKK